MAKVFQTGEEETGSLASLKKRVSQIPAGGAAPAPDGSGGENDFTRNVNNGLNALGGMGVVASVPLKAAQAAQGAVRPAMNALPVLTNSIPRLGAPVSQNLPAVTRQLPAVIQNTQIPIAKTVNVALQEGAQANQMAAAVRSAAGVNAIQGQLVDNQPPKPAGALPVNPAVSPVNPAQQAAATVPPPTAAQPADSNAIVTSENQRRNASELRNEFSNASVLARNPGGAVRKITDANGKVTGYSGGNVTGEVSMTDANGAPLRGNTRGISSMDTSAGYASNLKQLAEIQAGKDQQNANMQAQADYAQNQVLQQKALQGNPAALALLKGRMASSDGRQAGQMTDQTTRRGQDINAGAVRQTNQLAQDKFGLESQGVTMDNQQKFQMLQIQKAMFDPQATPEQRAEATKQFMALNGKTQASQYDFAPGGQAVIDGQLVTQPGVIFNKATGDAKTPGAQQQKANTTSKADYDKLPAGSVYTGQDGKQYKKG